MPRDDFSPTTRRKLGERAGYFCSNPECRVNTIGPHSDPEKSLSTGIAAHICGAALGGPRYDPNQTTDERISITNGIWLCATCSRLVDGDEKHYPPALLKQWKEEHEVWVSGQEMIPKIPDLYVETLQGLSLPLNSGTITADDNERFRERLLVLRNPNRVALLQFDLRIQLPEPVVALVRPPEIPPGVNLVFQPLRPQFMATSSGEGASVTVTRSQRPTPNASFKLDRLPPQTEIRVAIRTIEDWMEAFDSPEVEVGDDIHLQHYIRGDYFFDYRREHVRRRILVPLRYERKTRAIESRPPQADDAPYTIAFVERFG